MIKVYTKYDDIPVAIKSPYLAPLQPSILTDDTLMPDSIQRWDVENLTIQKIEEGLEDVKFVYYGGVNA